MIASLTYGLATIAVVIAGAFGFHVQTASKEDGTLREWSDRGTLCDAPHNDKAASLCELLEDE